MAHMTAGACPIIIERWHLYSYPLTKVVNVICHWIIQNPCDFVLQKLWFHFNITYPTTKNESTSEQCVDVCQRARVSSFPMDPFKTQSASWFGFFSTIIRAYQTSQGQQRQALLQWKTVGKISGGKRSDDHILIWQPNHFNDTRTGQWQYKQVIWGTWTLELSIMGF